MVSSGIRLAWLQKLKKRAGTVRDWCMSDHDYLTLVICVSSACRDINHYRDNAITYKAQRDKNARKLKLAERGNYWRRSASA